MEKRWQFAWVLPGILGLGLGLRLWQLGLKPIWLDEVITALFGLGRSYLDVPLAQVLPVNAVEQVFRWRPETTCSQIVETVTVQSVHPPLFFCWLHHWLGWLEPLNRPWLWKIRAFAVVFGVVAIAALYQLNRVLFSRRAGWLGAAFMAVSPFAVYLSQEARHYTLPMVLITLALLGTYQVYWDLHEGRKRPWLWLGWVTVNALGFYVHYFFVLSFMAQVMTLGLCLWLDAHVEKKLPAKSATNATNPRFPAIPSFAVKQYFPQQWRHLTLLTLAVCLTYLPWVPIFYGHITRSETDWMQPTGPRWSHGIAPLYQLPGGWVTMLITLPVERQPLWLKLFCGAVMLIFCGWVLGHLVRRLRRLWQSPQARPGLRLLLLYLLVVLIEFFGIIYLLNKDLTLVPRYNFIYFPAVVALVGAGLAVSSEVTQPLAQRYRLAAIVLTVATLSSGLTVNNWAFQKPYYPDEIARHIQSTPTTPSLVGILTRDWQDVALGLSVALAMEPVVPQKPDFNSHVFLLPRSPEIGQAWSAIAQLPAPFVPPFHFWVVAPRLPREQFPAELSLEGDRQQILICQIDSSQHYRREIAHQLYRCQ